MGSVWKRQSELWRPPVVVDALSAPKCSLCAQCRRKQTYLEVCVKGERRRRRFRRKGNLDFEFTSQLFVAEGHTRRPVPGDSQARVASIAVKTANTPALAQPELPSKTAFSP